MISCGTNRQLNSSLHILLNVLTNIKNKKRQNFFLKRKRPPPLLMKKKNYYTIKEEEKKNFLNPIKLILNPFNKYFLQDKNCY